ncbi:MAG: carboxypeptidase-like regulatory domain-containing protein, partial [Prosthecochloris sp.]|uniref:carboxypeptidase-like regulatory domain-containing protein n=1 Tax=Prosthecochloris sp. TaxID=290513 RepID=UPI00258765E4
METRYFSMFPPVRSLLTALILTILFLPLQAHAAGGLKGSVTDKTDGEPVIGASVMLENTTLGAASDFDGNYAIQNIPAGTYNLKITGVGYAQQTKNVTIADGQTATLNLQLAETTIMASEIVIGGALYEQD